MNRLFVLIANVIWIAFSVLIVVVVTWLLMSVIDPSWHIPVQEDIFPLP